METLIIHKVKGTATLTLNRPDKYNSINTELAQALQMALEKCAHDEDIRCIVLTGKGRAFCAGQDLGEVVDPKGPSIDSIVRENYNPIIMAIRSIEKPVIGAVNGVAAGAGANIALACDVVIATYSASFMQAFSNIGLIPDSGGTYTLPRLIGWQKASALMMLAEKVPALEAERMGMIYKCFPDEIFQQAVHQLTSKLSQMPTLGLAYTKRALNHSAVNSLQQQLNLEDQLQSLAGTTYDYHEGVQSFLEKRKPIFKGK
ncbi:MAG TPA: enoyl-CoA hydratase-related protein [Saprospiraceae bacterium]|nr:enoyl-CoA hydratase-related protein [Saprospiraceae bacterium]